MLLEEIDLALEKGCLLSKEAFHPLPRIDERDVWDNLDPEVKAYYSGQAVALEGRPIAPLTARMYAEFDKSGDRVTFERPYFDRRKTLFSLLMCECLENKGRYIPDIEDLVWAICEETTWVVPAHLYQNSLGDGKSKPLASSRLAKSHIDLFAAETASMLSWTVYLLGSRLKDEIVSRIDGDTVDERHIVGIGRCVGIFKASGPRLIEINLRMKRIGRIEHSNIRHVCTALKQSLCAGNKGEEITARSDNIILGIGHVTSDRMHKHGVGTVRKGVAGLAVNQIC